MFGYSNEQQCQALHGHRLHTVLKSVGEQESLLRQAGEGERDARFELWTLCLMVVIFVLVLIGFL